MPRTILVADVDKPLGGLLAAWLLATSRDTVVCWAPDAPGTTKDALEQRLRALWAGSTPGARMPLPETFALGLRSLEGLPREQERFDEVWSLGPTQGLTLACDGAPPSAPHRLLALLHGRPVGAFNHVSTLHVAGSKPGTIREEPFDAEYPANTPDEDAERAAEREVVAWCREAGIPCRIFRPAMPFGIPLTHHTPGGLQGFLAALLRFKELLDAKSPSYLQQRSLRLVAAPGASLDIIGVEQALEWMCQLSRDPALLEGFFHLVSPETCALEQFGQHLGAVTGLKPEWVGGGMALDPAETLLRARTAAFEPYLTQPRHFDSTRARQAAPGTRAARDTRGGWESFHSQWMASRRESHHEAARALETLERRTLDAGDTGPIEYQSAGSGPVLVCINAASQGLTVWGRFLAHFLRSHRVIYWSPRGVKEQVAVLERILEQERVRECRLIAWCSGARLALELLSRGTSASAMVLITGSYSPLPGLERLETAFQKTLRRMCQLVSQRPEMASLVRTSMVSMLAHEQTPPPGSPQGGPENVLATPSRELRQAIAEPFNDVRSIRHYSLQVLEESSRDITPLLGKVTAPALLISGELDQIVSPELSRRVAERLPAAHSVQLRGATHYCLHENAEQLIGLVERFFESPRNFRPAARPHEQSLYL
ncbi:MAG TPA: alpha/beta hydrolase [Archangium sp.]|uniref:serine aminopeptidase domain-containing protein n=1 Tax=Archangium sp. TaxID=1872627 RepID=UPI002E34657D|nr:alpha/beta hydrolase [Archangium sp.]HEX5747349.1 alpha/beta hydrolase [Archangium sp.]